MNIFRKISLFVLLSLFGTGAYGMLSEVPADCIGVIGSFLYSPQQDDRNALSYEEERAEIARFRDLLSLRNSSWNMRHAIDYRYAPLFQVYADSNFTRSEGCTPKQELEILESMIQFIRNTDHAVQLELYGVSGVVRNKHLEPLKDSENIASLTNIRGLTIANCEHITDAGIARVNSALSSLLIFNSGTITGETFGHLTNLKELYLESSATLVPDAFDNLTKLEELSVINVQGITTEHFRNLKNLKVLYVQGENITIDTVQLAEYCPELETIECYDCPNMSLDGLPLFQKLRVLDCRENQQVSNEIILKCKNLTKLRVSSYPHISGEIFVKLERLQSFTLKPVTDFGIGHGRIAQSVTGKILLPRGLRKLSITGSNIDDNTLLMCPKLEKLNVSNCTDC